MKIIIIKNGKGGRRVSNMIHPSILFQANKYSPVVALYEIGHAVCSDIVDSGVRASAASSRAYLLSDSDACKKK